MRVSEVLTMISPENTEDRNSLMHSGVAVILALRGGTGRSGAVQLCINPWHHM